MTDAAPGQRAGDEPLLRAGIAAFGAIYVLLGLWMAVAPGSFFDEIGPFGAKNEHYVRDVASWQLALGAILLLSLRHRRLRLGALALTALQAALHALNHLVDVGDADPSWLGPFDLVALAVSAALALWLLRAEAGR